MNGDLGRLLENLRPRRDKGPAVTSTRGAHPRDPMEDYLHGRGSTSGAAHALTDWRPGDPAWLAGEHLDTAVLGMATRGFQIESEEDRRHGEALDIMHREFGRADVPTLSEGDLQRMFSRETDRAAEGELADMDFLRSSLGGAGITGGGTAAAQAARINLTRLGQVTSAKRDVRITKAMTDMEDRAARFQRGLSLAALTNESPSMVGLDTLGSIAALRFAQQGTHLGYDAALKSAEAMEKAGEQSMWGQIAGGALGMLGGLF